MLTSSLPPSACRSASMKAFFAEAGLLIAWDKSAAQVIALDSFLEKKVIQYISFNDAEVADVASFGNELFVLTRIPLGSTWASLDIPQHAVHAVIRVWHGKAIVRLTGPTCVTSFWSTPGLETPEWTLVYQELTWDPEEIAKELGFENSAEEITSRRCLASVDEGPEGGKDSEEEILEERSEYRDREILDHIYLSIL
ncbi:hypothetical protein B0H10DRAFT_2230173 [Mycena sp. CBHHK59/15]|nr:hypothetical protein B0H10DRAFT_2230173 [Mycena sp. CBHHK59/15]